MKNSKKRGVFINTSKASCSIHESGLMVYSCLSQGDDYDIDYFSLDMIDLGVLASEGRIKLRDTANVPATDPQDQYDFWVFNWHFVTMAVDLNPSVIAGLPGPKFTIVLELAPGDPLQLVPQGVFEAYIALDPGAVATETIYPFPRPLDGDLRALPETSHTVPVIGSFGFATPGKGFEYLVQAVNEEFDRAIVRINIPSGDFIGTDIIHDCDYARYLEGMCRKIAKPGIEVRFTYDFMTAEQLIDWCGDNDLNCFMYTRCQPGLSATTDQAIMSGRPLLTSSNDTFRHIHQYIKPYPLTSLREAIATTVPMVQAMQRDWSKAAFNARFARMLADHGVLDELDVPPTPAFGGASGCHDVLVATTRALARGILDRPQRLANALQRTGQYQVTCRQFPDLDAVMQEARGNAYDAVVLTEFVSTGEDFLSVNPESFSGAVLHVGEAPLSRAGSGALPMLCLPELPIIPYYTVTNPLDDVPTVWLLGFASEPSVLRAMLDRVARELPGARVCVQTMGEAVEAVTASIHQLGAEWSGITVEALPPAPDGDATIHRFASSRMIVVRNVEAYSDELRNQAEIAMITERAVVFSREAPFLIFGDRALFVEDHGLREMIERGMSAQIKLVQAFAEGPAFATLQHALAPLLDGLPGRPAPQAIDVAPDENIIFLEAAFQRHLGRLPDPIGLAHYLGRLKADVPRRRIERDLKRSAEARRYREIRRDRPATGPHVSNLLGLDGERFVRRAYQDVLGRKADPAGLAHHLRLLDSGESKEAIIAGLCRSGEGRTNPGRLAGLEQLVRRHERSRSGLRKWLPGMRRGRRAILERSLNVIEHRMFELGARLEEAKEECAAARRLIEQHEGTLLALPGVPKAKPSAIVAGPVVPGTMFVLVGSAGASTRPVSAYTLGLVRVLLAQGWPVRLVEWDPESRRLQFAARTTIKRWQWEELAGLSPAEYPPDEAVQIILDKGTAGPFDWLIVPDTLRHPGDPEIIVEVDVIIEGRRLGLESTFLFHGAGALRDPAATADSVACQDQFMQAMLLSDSVIATSPLALDEIELYFSVSQHADFAPPLGLAILPASDTADGWRAHAAALADALEHAKSDATFVACHILDPGPDDAGDSLVRALRDRGIDAACACWDDQTGQLHLADSGHCAGILLPESRRAVWLVVACRGNWLSLPAVIKVAHARDMRVALMVDSTFDFAALSSESRLLASLVRADKLVCDSEEVSDRLWNSLLGTRAKFLAAEDRIVVIPQAQSRDSDRAGGSRAARLARSLATDRPRDRVFPLASRSGNAARLAMPMIRRRPKLSLCISTYNRAKWLRTSLENIFRQMPDVRDDLEVLVVDNCSTDTTPEVGRQFAYRPDFRFVRNPVNVGMLGNLAVTAQRARGDYVWILGDDDLTRNGVIAKVLDLLHDRPELELVYMNYGYTTEATPDQVTDLDAFLDSFNILQPACPDEYSTVARIAAKTENFYTAIYSHVYRRDHAMRSYCQDTSGRIFATMRSCIPTSYYVLNYMGEAPAYWIGDQALVVNSNVSWADYGALLDLEHLPAAWDLAERIGCPPDQVDMRRANRLWLVEMMWRDIFENDKVGNAAYFSARRVITRLRHLPEFEKHVPEFRRIYEKAHYAGNLAAALEPAVLFGAF